MIMVIVTVIVIQMIGARRDGGDPAGPHPPGDRRPVVK